MGLHPVRPQLRAPGAGRRLIDASARGRGRRADAPVLIDQEGGRVARLGPPHWPARCAAAPDRPARRARPGGRPRGRLAARTADRGRPAAARHHDRLRAGARSGAAGVHRRDRRSGAQRRSRRWSASSAGADRGLPRRRRAAGDQASAGPWPRPGRQPSGAAGGRRARARGCAATDWRPFRDLSRARRSRSPRTCCITALDPDRPATLSARDHRGGDPRRARLRRARCSATI